jgi:hypothetical protein
MALGGHVALRGLRLTTIDYKTSERCRSGLVTARPPDGQEAMYPYTPTDIVGQTLDARRLRINFGNTRQSKSRGAAICRHELSANNRPAPASHSQRRTRAT